MPLILATKTQFNLSTLNGTVAYSLLPPLHKHCMCTHCLLEMMPINVKARLNGRSVRVQQTLHKQPSQHSSATEKKTAQLGLLIGEMGGACLQREIMVVSMVLLKMVMSFLDLMMQVANFGLVTMLICVMVFGMLMDHMHMLQPHFSHM